MGQARRSAPCCRNILIALSVSGTAPGTLRSMATTAPGEWKEFLAARDWHAVTRFYAATLTDPSAVHSGRFPARDVGSDVSHWTCGAGGGSVHSSDDCSGLQAAAAGGKGHEASHWRKARATFLAEIAYVGGNFSGLQRVPGRRTIVGELESTVAPLVLSDFGEKKPEKHIPGLAYSGRTDAGVSAYGNVLSFHTWQPGVDAQLLASAIDAAAPGEIRALRVMPVPRAFHANFAACWRRYIYLFPLTRLVGDAAGAATADAALGAGGLDVDVERVKAQLQEIKGRPLHYKALAYKRVNKLELDADADVCRLLDADASLFSLPPTLSSHAHLPGVILPCEHQGTTVLVVELKADRFLRRMVRILVSTAVREAVRRAAADSTRRIIESGDRSLAAMPAPSAGLCFVGAGYGAYDMSLGGAAIRQAPLGPCAAPQLSGKEGAASCASEQSTSEPKMSRKKIGREQGVPYFDK